MNKLQSEKVLYGGKGRRHQVAAFHSQGTERDTKTGWRRENLQRERWVGVLGLGEKGDIMESGMVQGGNAIKSNKMSEFS